MGWKDAQNQSLERLITLQHPGLMRDMKRNHTAIQVGVHVALVELNQAWYSLVCKCAERLENSDEACNKFCVTNTGLSSTDDERVFQGVRALEYFVDTLDFDQVTQRCSCQYVSKPNRAIELNVPVPCASTKLKSSI